jgi:hypothetical protein
MYSGLTLCKNTMIDVLFIFHDRESFIEEIWRMTGYVNHEKYHKEK